MKVLKFGVLIVGIGFGVAIAQSKYALSSGLGFEFQRLNNCGPMTAKMALSLAGIRVSQAEAAAALKGSYPDRNVTTPELANYLQANGLQTIRRWLITPDLVRSLVKADFAVILHQQQKTNSDIGHFRVAYGFDQNAIISGDSMFGAKFRLTNREFAIVSKPYNGEYLIAYRPKQRAALQKILGKNWNRQLNLERLAQNSRLRLKNAPSDSAAWWGLGQAYLYQGLTKSSAKAFSKSHSLGLTVRQYWYQHDAFEAWNKAGLYQQTIRVAATALKGYPNSREINAYYATALEQLGQYKKALTAWQAAAKEDPRSSQVQIAIQRLTQKIEKR